jgi:hypothetical protein
MGEDTTAHRDNIQKLIQYFRDVRRTLIRAWLRGREARRSALVS